MLTKFATKIGLRLFTVRHTTHSTQFCPLRVFKNIRFSKILAQIHYLYVDRFRTKRDILVLGKRYVHKELI